VQDWFNGISKRVSGWVGSPWCFALAMLVIVVWLVSGPIFRYSDTWQLIINTGTTIVTFLMVFLIQNTQNRDNKAIHLKLDEIIRSTDKARNALIDLEDVKDEQLDELKKEFEDLRVQGDVGADEVLEELEDIRSSRQRS
jgi:low affinity Fe/Cu permease